MNFSKTDNIKIVVTEDDEFLQCILREFLSKSFKVETFLNGMDALEFIQDGHVPDLIIADLNTPIINGLGLIEQIKTSNCFNEIPIIVLSGEESTLKRIECLDAGADDFMTKPFNPQELEARIKAVLRRTDKIIYN